MLSEEWTARVFSEGEHGLMAVAGTGPSQVDRALTELGLSRRVTFRSTSPLVVAMMAAETDLRVTTTRTLAERLADMLPLRILELPVDAAPLRLPLVWHERNANDLRHQWLRCLTRRPNDSGVRDHQRFARNPSYAPRMGRRLVIEDDRPLGEAPRPELRGARGNPCRSTPPRRLGGHPAHPPACGALAVRWSGASEPLTLRLQGCAPNVVARRLARGDAVIVLTPADYAVSEYLAERLARPARRAHVSDAVLAHRGTHESAPQTHVSRMRRGLGPDAARLQTAGRIGDRLSPSQAL